jgi:O-antigen/teichoic acid export membrane protein
VFWTGLAGGILFSAIGVALSPFVARFYDEPKVQPLFAALSLSFVAASVGTTHRAILARELDFKRLELRMMIGTVVGAAAGIAVALRGGGAWAIITQQLTVTIVSTVLLWIMSSWRPRFVFSPWVLRDIAGMSGNVFGQRLLYYIQQNADNLLIGRFLGPTALGAYAVAYNIMLVPFSQIAVPVQEVMFPALVRLSDPEEIVRLWLRATRLIGAVAIPALVGLIVVAPEFVHVVLGNRWSAAVPVVQILAGVGLLQALQSVNTSVLLALDKTHILFRYTIGFTASHLIAFSIGLHWGIVGVAAAYAISNALVEPIFLVLTARAAGTGPRRFVSSLRNPVEASLVMVAALLAARPFVLELDSAALELVLLLVIGAAAYLAAIVLRAPDLVDELRRLRRRRSSAPALAADR